MNCMPIVQKTNKNRLKSALFLFTPELADYVILPGKKNPR